MDPFVGLAGVQFKVVEETGCSVLLDDLHQIIDPAEKSFNKTGISVLHKKYAVFSMVISQSSKEYLE